MVKYVADSSSLIDMWRYYLRSTGLFIKFWEWLLKFLHEERIVIPRAVFKELEQIEGDFAKLLKESGVNPFNPDDEIRRQVRAIAEELNIQWEDDIHPKGISEADAYVIATAKRIDATVLTEEHQPEAPKEERKHRYRMPSVCELESVDVPHINLQGFLIAIVENGDC